MENTTSSIPRMIYETKNNRPTPETDALAVVCYGEGGIEASHGFRAVPIKDCRKLERERDEARDQRNRLHELHNQNAIHHNELLELCVTLRKERDEAQNASEAFSALAWKLEGERNEAREAFKMEYNERVQMELDRNGWAAMCGQYKTERDEALKEVEHWKDMYRTVSTF